MTLAEIYALPIHDNGWRVLPNGKYVSLGEQVTWEGHFICARIGDFARIGNRVNIGKVSSIGNHVSIGNLVSIDNSVWIGDGVWIGAGARIGKYASIGSDVWIGAGARIGNCARIGNGARIGGYARIGDDTCIVNGARIGAGASFNKSPIAIQGTQHLACQSSPGVITIGCCTYSFEHWTKHVLGIARQHGYTDAEALEYQRIVKFIVDNGIPAEAPTSVKNAAQQSIGENNAE